MIDIFLLPYKVFRRICRIYSNRKLRKELRHFGSNSYVLNPLKIHSPENILIGNNVRIGNHTWLAAVPLTGEENCELVFQDGLQ